MGGPSLIWFYAKRGRHRRCEIRHELEGDRLELIVTEPDGREHVESFLDSLLLRKRSHELEEQWKAQGWDGPFGRDY